nr:hypothetical protein CFP56_28682 [Quercus suber]
MKRTGSFTSPTAADALYHLSGRSCIRDLRSVECYLHFGEGLCLACECRCCSALPSAKLFPFTEDMQSCDSILEVLRRCSPVDVQTWSRELGNSRHKLPSLTRPSEQSGG